VFLNIWSSVLNKCLIIGKIIMMYPVVCLKVTNQGTKLNLGVFVVVQVIL
jgi:hypothetical protein